MDAKNEGFTDMDETNWVNRLLPALFVMHVYVRSRWLTKDITCCIVSKFSLSNREDGIIRRRFKTWLVLDESKVRFPNNTTGSLENDTDALI